jgi:hypothetical protein
LHIVYVADFAVSLFEEEFGRHIAILLPAPKMIALRERLTTAGAQVVDPLRPSARQRFFRREPVNAYMFEVIAQGE